MENNNKLIAEFMEFQYTSIGWYDAEESLNLKGDNTFDELKFDTDWNWLMPVVERIELDMGFDVYIHYNNCTITDGENAFENEAEPNQKIYATYQSVIEFIKWYNNKQ